MKDRTEPDAGSQKSPTYGELYELVCRIGYLLYFDGMTGTFTLHEPSNYPTAAPEIYKEVRTIVEEAKKNGWKFE
jgi:hypothetical protein